MCRSTQSDITNEVFDVTKKLTLASWNGAGPGAISCAVRKLGSNELVTMITEVFS